MRNVTGRFACRMAALALFGSLALAACEPPAPQPPVAAQPDQPPLAAPPPAPPPVAARDEFIIRLAGIQSIEIVVFESFPVQVRVVVAGYLSDGCTTLKPVEEVREGNVFRLTILSSRPTAAMCTQAIVRFHETFPLDVEGLKAGLYTVDVNGNSKTFRLR